MPWGLFDQLMGKNLISVFEEKFAVGFEIEEKSPYVKIMIFGSQNE